MSPADGNGSEGPLGTSLRVYPDADRGAMFEDHADRSTLVECKGLAIGGLAEGTSGGNASVVIRATTPAGETVVMETTLALLLTAADALKARHGDPRRS